MLCRLQLKLDVIARRIVEERELQKTLEEEERKELEEKRRNAPKPPLPELITAVLRHELDQGFSGTIQ